MLSRAMATVPASDRKQQFHYSDAYRSYVLGLLFVAYACCLLDRVILSMLQESIKKDLGLSDSQLGILTGFGFSIFYGVLGIPIARWADHSVRARVIGIALFLWSLMTALSGFGKNFTMLLAFRIGVSVGEAGCTPPAHSLIADYFPRSRRGTAISIYSLGGSLGVVVGLATAGWLNEIVGWRQTFVVVAAPGLLISLVIYFTLREPPRGLSDGQAAHDHGRIAIKDGLHVLWACAPFRYLTLGYCVLSVVANAVVSWNPPFYSRIHGLGSGEIGTRLALCYALPLAVGTILGGSLGDRLARRDMRWYLWLPGIAALATFPMALSQYNVASPAVSFALSIGPAFTFGMYVGPCFGVTQMLAPVPIRALACSVLLLVISTAGVGLGPVLTGAISDLFRAQGHGAASLGQALTLVTLLLIPAGALLLWAGRKLPEALANHRTAAGGFG